MSQLTVSEWVAESINEVGKEETVALLHDAYLSNAPDEEILAALRSLGDTTYV